MKSLAVSATVCLLACYVTNGAELLKRVKRQERPGFDLNATGFMDFMYNSKEEAEMFAQDDVRFANAIDKPRSQINWTEVDLIIAEVEEESRLFRSYNDVLVSMLSALWSGSCMEKHLDICGDLKTYVMDLVDPSLRRMYDMDTALRYFADDLRCMANLMRTVFWYDGTTEFPDNVDLMKAIVHTLTDLIRLNWVDENLSWAAYMAFEVLPSEHGYLDSVPDETSPVQRGMDAAQGNVDEAELLRLMLRRLLDTSDTAANTAQSSRIGSHYTRRSYMSQKPK